MNSILICSRDKNLRKTKAVSICKAENISDLDIYILNLLTFRKDKKVTNLSIGIEDVKNLQKSIYLKPLKSSMKSCIIEDAQLLTNEAQNALLKILEEPPNNTLIILTADSKETFLPTILSRCRIIELENLKTIPEADAKEFTVQFDKLLTLNINNLMHKAEIVAKNKNEALTWIENATIILRSKLITSIQQEDKIKIRKYTNYLAELQNTYKIIKTFNVNLRFSVEKLFLALYKN